MLDTARFFREIRSYIEEVRTTRHSGSSVPRSTLSHYALKHRTANTAAGTSAEGCSTSMISLVVVTRLGQIPFYCGFDSYRFSLQQYFPHRLLRDNSLHKTALLFRGAA